MESSSLYVEVLAQAEAADREQQRLAREQGTAAAHEDRL
jgi:hypothetical protein